ncbi:helix-turn-helix domain-containing protein [Spirosoma arcticum]
MAGLNEYKLKQGFKELFQATAFEYLAQHRLQAARQALLESSKTAAEVAYEWEYSSPQYFNNIDFSILFLVFV